VSGHRIGTAEIEDALDEHDDVAESAVVSYPHDIYGEGIFAFVVLKQDCKTPEKDLPNQLKQLVKSKIAAYAVPQEILVHKNLFTYKTKLDQI
jgi:acetyl-CoA synthetase